MFILIAAVILTVQILLSEVPGLQEMFNFAEGGIKFWDWIIIIVGTSLVVWVGEIRNLIKRSALRANIR